MRDFALPRVRSITLLALSFVSLELPTPLFATPISYIEQVNAVGTLGALAFNGPITITFSGDTDDVSGPPNSGLFRNQIGHADVVTPVGNAKLSGHVFSTTANQTLTANHPTPSVQISDTTQNLLILGTRSAAFSAYDLKTEISPVTGVGSLNSGRAFPTTSGDFILNSLNGGSTFRAVSASTMQGGTTFHPTTFEGSISQIDGKIGGDSGAVDFYSFSWPGGPFGVTSAVFGALAPQTFAFELFSIQPFPFGAPPILVDSETLSSVNGFQSSISQPLNHGTYLIGLIADSPTDPDFRITFAAPVRGTLVPEPSTIWLLLTGFAGILGLRNKITR